jgi:hypothetical protein
MTETKSNIFFKVQSILKRIETIQDTHNKSKDTFIDTIFKHVIDKFTSKMTDKTKYKGCLSVKSNTIKKEIFDLLTRHKILKLNTEKVEEFEIDINPFAILPIAGEQLNGLRKTYNEIVVQILNIGNSIRIYDYEIDNLDLPDAIDKYVSSKDVQDGFNFYSTINDRIGNICFSEDTFVELMNASLVGSTNPENTANNESSVSSNSNSNISNFESFNIEAHELGLTENNPTVENRTPFPHSNVYPESSNFSGNSIVMNNTLNPLYSGRTDGEVNFGNDGAKDDTNNVLRDIMSQSDVATPATPAPTAKVATEAEAVGIDDPVNFVSNQQVDPENARVAEAVAANEAEAASEAEATREAAEAREREAAEAREREAAEAREREAAEARERETAEAREREAAEAREREAAEAREREAAEVREREAAEAREREAAEAREREAAEAREREAAEAREREAAEAREREAAEARETAEREAAEARETAEREAAEAREREREAAEAREREAAEAREREAAEARERVAQEAEEREAEEKAKKAARKEKKEKERKAAEVALPSNKPPVVWQPKSSKKQPVQPVTNPPRENKEAPSTISSAAQPVIRTKSKLEKRAEAAAVRTTSDTKIKNTKNAWAKQNETNQNTTPPVNSQEQEPEPQAQKAEEEETKQEVLYINNTSLEPEKTSYENQNERPQRPLLPHRSSLNDSHRFEAQSAQAAALSETVSNELNLDAEERRTNKIKETLVPKGCEGRVEDDANKLVKSYIQQIIPAKINKDPNLESIQIKNKKIYEECHKYTSDTEGHLMNKRKEVIVKEFHRQYILGYLAEKNRQKALDKIKEDGQMNIEKIETATAISIKHGTLAAEKTKHGKIIEKLIRDANAKDNEHYGYTYPEFGWNKLKNTEKFNRILNFFKFTFGYDESNAIKQATTFSPPWHIDRPSPTTVKPTGLALKTFVNVWGTGEMHEKETTTMKHGGRKTKKKRKKNASPSKTRKVKKQKK